MDQFIVKLINLRKSDDKVLKSTYKKSFKTESQFLIRNNEFIPFGLFKSFKKGEENLQEIISKFGKPVVTTKHDKALSKFYKKYSLKRDINYIADSISYLVIQEKEKPSDSEEVVSDFYNFDKIIELSAYQNEPYHADKEDLRQIGQSISDHILQPTNFWLDQLNFGDFEKTPERYWQVAGLFKKRIWGKLQRPDHIDKKVFFCLGIDLESQTLFYGLECLRTGTSKLSTEQIFKFDHITKGISLIEQILLSEQNIHNWESLIKQSEDFMTRLIPMYDQVIDYIWNDQVDIQSINNLLVPLTAKKPTPDDQYFESNKKTKALAVDLVVSYEKSLLKYKDKKKLSKKVCKTSASDDNYDVISYHLDGSEKLIKVIASKTSSLKGAMLKQTCIDASIISQEKTYIYTITNISSKRKSGMLYINKGRFDKIFKTKPERYTVVF